MIAAVTAKARAEALAFDLIANVIGSTSCAKPCFD